MAKLKFGLDKIIHFLAGYGIVTTTYIFTLDLVLAMTMCIIGGGLKELYDKYHPLTNTLDVHDFLATQYGGLLACALILLKLVFMH